MKETDVFRLQHMLDAAREIKAFVEGRKRGDLDHDRSLVLILTKEIEIIGEAASKVSDEGRIELQGIEWIDIVSMRNRLVHIYYDINLDILWNTVIDDIPKLIGKLEKLSYLH